MLGQVEHILRNFHVLDVVDVFLLVADFVGLADQRPHEAFAASGTPDIRSGRGRQAPSAGAWERKGPRKGPIQSGVSWTGLRGVTSRSKR